MTKCALLLMLVPIHGFANAGEAKQPPEQWTTVRSVQKIPAEILKVLRGQFAYDNRLADVGEQFDATDALTGLPRRRLVMAGHTATEWFVAYEHGGRAHHLDLVILNTQGAVPKLIAAFDIGAGVHDDTNGWQLALSDLQPILDSPRPTVHDDLRAH